MWQKFESENVTPFSIIKLSISNRIDIETKRNENVQKCSDQKKNINVYYKENNILLLKPKRNESFFSGPSHKSEANKAWF